MKKIVYFVFLILYLVAVCGAVAGPYLIVVGMTEWHLGYKVFKKHLFLGAIFFGISIILFTVIFPFFEKLTKNE